MSISKKKNISCVLCNELNLGIKNLSYHHISPHVGASKNNGKASYRGKIRVVLCKDDHRRIHRLFTNQELRELAQNKIYPSKLKFKLEFEKRSSLKKKEKRK